jgi:hypothetical protein
VSLLHLASRQQRSSWACLPPGRVARALYRKSPSNYFHLVVLTRKQQTQNTKSNMHWKNLGRFFKGRTVRPSPRRPDPCCGLREPMKTRSNQQ